MRRHHRVNWQTFRKEVIELDGGVCVRCGRSPPEGAILQIHHKQYLPGKLPWEYPYEMCETLCKGCHAGEHGIVRPFSGWECVGYDDLGDITGECELCGTALRYIFFVQHEKWPSLEVGEICCDYLTNTNSASKYINTLYRFTIRLQRFVSSKRWREDNKGILRIHQKGFDLAIEPTGQYFRVVVNDIHGKRQFPTSAAAAAFVFKLLETGNLESFAKRWAPAR